MVVNDSDFHYHVIKLKMAESVEQRQEERAEQAKASGMFSIERSEFDRLQVGFEASLHCDNEISMADTVIQFQSLHVS